MSFSYFTDAKAYFQPYEDSVTPGSNQFRSARGRLFCLGTFLQKLLLLPFALFFKTYKTFFRLIGVLLSASLLLLSLGISEGIKEFFFRRTASLARDLADWILLPFAALTCFIRLLLGSAIHPAFYFGL